MKEQITRNFTLSELIKSNTAMRRGYDNTPNITQYQCLVELTENILQPLRDYFGTGIYISSGFRGERLNVAIGGATNSQHVKGQAVDIDQDNKGSRITNAQVFNYIRRKLPFDQLIWEFGNETNPAWVHVSYNKDYTRKEVLRAFKDDGKVKYINY